MTSRSSRVAVEWTCSTLGKLHHRLDPKCLTQQTWMSASLNVLNWKRVRETPWPGVVNDRKPSICVTSETLFRLETCLVALHLARGYIFHALHWFSFSCPCGRPRAEARAPEPSTPERASPPPRRRRACNSPKSRTARRRPHAPQPSSLTRMSALAAATAQPPRPPGQTPRHSRPLFHGC